MQHEDWATGGGSSNRKSHIYANHRQKCFTTNYIPNNLMLTRGQRRKTKLERSLVRPKPAEHQPLCCFPFLLDKILSFNYWTTDKIFLTLWPEQFIESLSSNRDTLRFSSFFYFKQLLSNSMKNIDSNKDVNFHIELWRLTLITVFKIHATQEYSCEF